MVPVCDRDGPRCDTGSTYFTPGSYSIFAIRAVIHTGPDGAHLQSSLCRLPVHTWPAPVTERLARLNSSRITSNGNS